MDKTLFYRLGAFMARWKKSVVAVSLVLLIVAVSFAPTFMNNMTTTAMYINDSEAEKAQQLIDTKFTKTFDEQDIIVFHSKQWQVSDEPFRQAIEKAIAAAKRVSGVKQVISPLQSPQQVSADGKTALAVVGIKGNDEAKAKIAADMAQRFAKFRGEVNVYFTGTTPTKEDMIAQQMGDVSRSEQVALPIALVILIVAFGSIVAAGLPMLLGMVGLMMTFGALGIISLFHSFDTTVQSIVSMIGLGVGIDYALFIVRRFREELASGKAADVAVAYTMATTGKAIFFSGLTVMISMGGLFWLNASVFTNVAIGTIVVVICMLTLALTLLPALLAWLGHRVNFLKVRKKASTGMSQSWYRWSKFVMKRPLMWTVVGVSILVLFTSQITDLKLGMDMGLKAIAHRDSGKGMLLVQEKFSSGLTSPVQLVIERKSGELTLQDWQAVERLTTTLMNDKEVYRVASLPQLLAINNVPLSEQALQLVAQQKESATFISEDKSTTLVSVTLKSASDSVAAADWVRDLQQHKPKLNDDLRVFVGGSTASIVELSDETMSKTGYVIVTVLLLSYVLLLVAFRSWRVPLKAIVLNLLSVGSAYGLLVFVFIHGNGVEAIPFVQVFLPVMVFAIVFGLSMDYEVFLVGRIKEEWGRTGDAEEAIARGIAYTSGPITQAALIMLAVFIGFMFTKASETQQIGFSLAVSIFVDVTIIRILLVPAIMRLLGAKAWAMPNWLDRIVPHVELSEGELDNDGES